MYLFNKITLNLCLFCIFAFLGNSNALASDNLVDETIGSLIAEKMGNDKLSIEIKYDSTSAISSVKTKSQKILSIKLDQFTGRNFSALVQYNNNKEDLISGTYVAFALVPVASRYIKQGEIIQTNDLSFTRIRLDNVRSDFAIDLDNVVGYQSNKQIASGSVIKTSDLTRPLVLKINDPVNITYSSGAISLKTSGIALGSGAIGDTIKVKNTTTGTILLGQIVNKNTVKVGGE